MPLWPASTLFLTVCRYHKASHPPSRPSWRCEAYLWPHLRGDSRRAQNLPRERTSCPHIWQFTPLTLHRSSVTRSHTPNTPNARPSPRSTSSMPSNVQDAHFTVSVLRCFHFTTFDLFLYPVLPSVLLRAYNLSVSYSLICYRCLRLSL